ncbi:MAG TPA: hypothetical protein VFY48_01115 [Solirubrobacterales bacterium]|nr:hypothetical protein [Solirubrobacterales bacterium]
MEASERDSTQDWVLPEGSAPPLMSELEQRIDEALVIARASEKAVVEVGAVALDAAQQARRAADIAERATAAVLAGGVGEAGAAAGVAADGAPPRQGEDAALRRFSERADRVVARLRALERRPSWGRAASAGAGQRRPGG